MPFQRKRANLILTPTESEHLKSVSTTRTESIARVERARIVLAYAANESVSSIARRLGTNRPKVERCVNKALEVGVLTALADLPRDGRPAEITPEARAWLMDLACQKPKDLGYSYELWTNDLLARHVRKHCGDAGHPCLQKLARGTVSKILSQSSVRPHKITYYLERRDPEFETKMNQVLYVYKEVQLWHEVGEDASALVAFLSFDEKPGIQAIYGARSLARSR